MTTSKDTMEVSKKMIWAVLGTLIMAVCFVSWEHINYRLNCAEEQSKAQGEVIVQNQTAIATSLSELKMMSTAFSSHIAEEDKH